MARTLRKTLRKALRKALRKTLRKTHRKTQRGGVNFQKNATTAEIEGVPVAGVGRTVVATEAGWVGNGKAYQAHEEYLSNQVHPYSP